VRKPNVWSWTFSTCRNLTPIRRTYNLGVMEHLERPIRKILAEFNRTLKPGGRLCFSGPRLRTIVIALKMIHFVLNHVLRATSSFTARTKQGTVSKADSKALGRIRLRSESFSSDQDAFTYAVIVARSAQTRTGMRTRSP